MRGGRRGRALEHYVRAYRINPTNMDSVRELRLAAARQRSGESLAAEAPGTTTRGRLLAKIFGPWEGPHGPAAPPDPAVGCSRRSVRTFFRGRYSQAPSAVRPVGSTMIPRPVRCSVCAKHPYCTFTASSCVKIAWGS